MRRRDVIVRLGAAAAWPLAAGAQPREQPRRIALLLPAHSTDPEFQANVGAFLQALEHAGWVIGRNAQLEYRWTEGNPDNTRKYIAELVALAPDVIVAQGASAVRAISQATAPFRLYSQSLAIRSARALSRHSRARAATSPGS